MAKKKPVVALAADISSSESESEDMGMVDDDADDVGSEDHDSNSVSGSASGEEEDVSAESDAESDQEIEEEDGDDDDEDEEEDDDEDRDDEDGENDGDEEIASSSNSRKNSRFEEDASAVSRAPKKSKQDLPSKDEQLQLHNTENLMRTNLLRLQIDEMLKEVRADASFEKKKLQVWLEGCTGAIKTGTAAMERARTNLSLAWIAANKIPGFVFEGKDHEQVSATFFAPTAVAVVGSCALKTATAPFVNVDITVSMPEQQFESRDVLNHAYFNKRKLYVAALYHVLNTAAGLEGDVSVCLLKGDPRKPILVIKPALKGGVTVRIIPTLSAATFKLVQLKLSKNNVRPIAWVEKESKSNAEGDKLKPTPRYNMAIMEDVAAQTQANFLSQTLSVCPVARDAVILFKVWLTQRSLRFGFDSMDSHSATLLVAYLVQTKRITNQMTAVAAFTLVLKLLIENDLSKCQMSFTNTSIVLGETSEHWAMTLFYPVFETSSGVDKQYDFNVMWRISSTCLADVCSEANHTLHLLQTGRSDSSFQRIFMSKVSFFDRHDLFFHIPFTSNCLSDALQRGKTGKSSSSVGKDIEHSDLATERFEEVDNAVADMVHWQYISSKAVAVAKRALGNRAVAIRVVSAPQTSTTVRTGVFYPQCGEEADRWVVTLGVVLSKEHGQRRIERGPAAEDEASVEQFRKFWGPNKSQLRRFQDGSIIEAVLWEEALQRPGYVPRGERIAEEVLRYVFARHLPVCCGKNAEHVYSKTTQLEHKVLAAIGISPASANSDDADTLTRKALENLDKLRTALISTLKDQLPLLVSSLTGTGAALRYTGLIPPQSHPLLQENFVQKYAGQQISLLSVPLEIFAQVEGGGKWPKEAGAILKLKLAFLLRLSDVLYSKMKVVCVPHEESLDIIFNAFVFRLRVVSDMEIEQRLVTSVGKEVDPNMVYPKQVVETNVVYPLYCNAIRALHAKFPTYASSVRLLESWLDSHYFSGAVPHEALEMLVASIYVDPDSGYAPTSPSAGFRKALLRLAVFDWEGSPLIVDFASEITHADRNNLLSKFTASRQGRHSPMLYMVSSADRHTGFTTLSAFEGIDRAVLRLVIAKAKETSAAYSRWVEDSGSTDDAVAIDSIMKSSTTMDRCNLILQFSECLINAKAIKSELGSQWYEQMQRGAAFARLKVFSNLSKKEVSIENLVVKAGATSHPVQEEVIETLRKGFGDVAIFFWNAQRGTEVGVLWKPSVFLTHKFSILESRNKIALQSEDSSAATIAVVNSSEVVAQMLRVGDGLFQQIRFL